MVALLLGFGLLAAACSSAGSEGQQQAEIEGQLPIPGSSRPSRGSAPGDPVIVGDLKLPNGIRDDLRTFISFDELAERYPDAVKRIQSSNLKTEAEFDAVYTELKRVYDGEGADGLHQFMLGTGLLQGLGLDTVYTDVALAYEDGGWEEAKVFASERGLVNEQDELRVLFELESADYSEVEPELDKLEVRVVEENGTQIEGGIKLDKLEKLGSSDELFIFMAQVAQLPGVIKVKLPTASVTGELPTLASDVGVAPLFQRSAQSVLGQGPQATGADSWHRADFTGRGVKIGIIDPDGFLNYDQLLGTDLPPTGRLTFMPGQDLTAIARTTGPHGTACAEVITEMAPDAELFLAHTTSEVAFANAIDWMIESDVDIISYSAGRPAEPIDGSGPSGSHVRRAIDAGILWVNSTGNFGLSHLDMNFTDTDGNGFHEFPSGDEVLPATPTGDDLLVSLVWDDPWTASQSNYDLTMLRAASNGELEVFSSSRNIQAGSAGDNPSEQVAGRSDGSQVFISISAPRSASGNRLNLLGHGMEFQYSIPEGSVAAPADLDSVLSVGATNWQDGILEPYSSQGPTWDGRLKPNIVAPTRVDSAAFKGEFFGTSASAPHVAAAAALVMQQYPEASEREIRQSLAANALDQEPEGIDNKTGTGNLNMSGGPADFRFVKRVANSDNVRPKVSNEDPAADVTSVEISKVVQDGQDALQLDVDVDVSNLKDQQVQIAGFFFFDTGRNVSLKDFNGRYASQKNTVAVGVTVEPVSQREQFRELSLTIPISELHLARGQRFELKVTTSVSSELAWADYLAISDWLPIIVET